MEPIKNYSGFNVYKIYNDLTTYNNNNKNIDEQ